MKVLALLILLTACTSEDVLSVAGYSEGDEGQACVDGSWWQGCEGNLLCVYQADRRHGVCRAYCPADYDCGELVPTTVRHAETGEVYACVCAPEVVR